MTYKQIETSREIRLWLGQLIIPAVTMSVGLLAIPEIRDAANEKVKKIRQSIKLKKNRES